MLDPGGTDPTNLQAHAHAWLGLSLQLKQTHCVMPYPCHGGGGYNMWFRKEQLAKAQAGEDFISLSRPFAAGESAFIPIIEKMEHHTVME